MKTFALLVTLVLQSIVFYGQPRHITVASDGSGEFTSVQEAVNSVRAYMSDTTYMFIRNGTYREKIVVPSWVTNLFMKGESAGQLWSGMVVPHTQHGHLQNPTPSGYREQVSRLRISLLRTMPGSSDRP
ncbi:MAG: pectinesterase family protein [Bacteroidales bacterium]|nr:pectinesterase family protein [Bacteroidales bacterium]